MKSFVSQGRCIESIHYMVKMSENIEKMEAMVRAGEYFIVSRPRQFGKTTTLYSLAQVLSKEYIIINMDMIDLDHEAFSSGRAFSKAFCLQVMDHILESRESDLLLPDTVADSIASIARGETTANLQQLFSLIRKWCRNSFKPVVLFIDEVDAAEGSDVFRDFLGKLRSAFIKRDPENMNITFQSVILAGVTDVEHLKSGIRPDDETRRRGSPWNIASNITIPMELPAKGVQQMLQEYKKDHGIRMNVKKVTDAIMKWTNGYPYLVSRICEILDTEMVPGRFKSLTKAWTTAGVDEAATKIVTEDSSLMSSLMGKINNDPALAQDLSDFLYKGKNISYSIDNERQRSFLLYGFARVSGARLMIANEIFRVRLCRKFDDDFHNKSPRDKAVWDAGEASKNKYVDPAGDLNVYRILEDFLITFTRVRKISTLPDEEAQENEFIEDVGCRQFLLYLTPVINSAGTYSIEEQTLDRRRMDVVIHYHGKRYILEIKIWHGAKYNSDGEQQLRGYLDYFNLNVGYMLTFSFNKYKKVGIDTHTIDGRILHEAIV